MFLRKQQKPPNPSLFSPSPSVFQFCGFPSTHSLHQITNLNLTAGINMQMRACSEAGPDLCVANTTHYKKHRLCKGCFHCSPTQCDVTWPIRSTQAFSSISPSLHHCSYTTLFHKWRQWSAKVWQIWGNTCFWLALLSNYTTLLHCFSDFQLLRHYPWAHLHTSYWRSVANNS